MISSTLAPCLLALCGAPAQGVTVHVNSPVEAATVSGMVTVAGTSTGLVSGRVSVSVDGGPFQLATGRDAWTFDWDTTTLAAGAHTLVARARECLTCTPAFDTVNVTAQGSSTGLQELDYVSSVDGVQLASRLWLPAGFDPNGAPVPLVCHLHGGGGQGRIAASMAAELDARGWIGIAPDGREWGLAQLGCDWPFSAAYVNNPDPNVGPGEQDIFDAIEAAAATLPVDRDRIYLTGFSMGGRGAYAIALKNPDYFAAIAPTGGPSDMFEVHVRRPENSECKNGMVGGVPGSTARVDTMTKITSARFLIENAFNLPVFHGHGLNDTVASNTPTESDYLHGFHMTEDSTFDACHADPDFCFGHTPTLAELHAHEPLGYDWAFMFTPVGHFPDPRWLGGVPVQAGILGTEDPQRPGELLGIYDFFERRSREHSPERVVFKTYEDEHRRAYWVDLLTSAPWSAEPAGVRATRDVAQNLFDVELTRAAQIGFDLDRSGLALTSEEPLLVVLAPLVDGVFDPALSVGVQPQATVIRLEGSEDIAGATVLFDGQVLEPAEVTVAGGIVTVGPLGLGTVTHLLEVRVAESYCTSALNSAGTSATLSTAGTFSRSRNDLELHAAGAIPNGAGLFFYGFEAFDGSLGNGRLCIGGTLQRAPVVTPLDGAGAGSYLLDLAAPPASTGPSAITAGATVRFQLWYRDAGTLLGSNSSNAVTVEFLP